MHVYLSWSIAELSFYLVIATIVTIGLFRLGRRRVKEGKPWPSDRNMLTTYIIVVVAIVFLSIGFGDTKAQNYRTTFDATMPSSVTTEHQKSDRLTREQSIDQFNQAIEGKKNETEH